MQTNPAVEQSKIIR